MDLFSQTVFMTDDHQWLKGEWVESETSVAAALVHPAIGVLASYYRALATWLARAHHVARPDLWLPRYEPLCRCFDPREQSDDSSLGRA